MKPLRLGTSVGPALEEADDKTRKVPIGIVVPQIPVKAITVSDIAHRSVIGHRSSVDAPSFLKYEIL